MVDQVSGVLAAYAEHLITHRVDSHSTLVGAQSEARLWRLSMASCNVLLRFRADCAINAINYAPTLSASFSNVRLWNTLRSSRKTLSALSKHMLSAADLSGSCQSHMGNQRRFHPFPSRSSDRTRLVKSVLEEHLLLEITICKPKRTGHTDRPLELTPRYMI